ncbi:Ku protein [Streptomyces sp. NPDC006450]|uniref:non-homologous end joining protein Ku n=1 Tax=Streptomyces sp. NPDC006450 TaxID=3155458 RepID=UPI0033B4B3B1
MTCDYPETSSVNTTIPIKVYPATESHAISFGQFHVADGGRVRYRKGCELDGQELDQGDITRGYETAVGTIVPVSDADLDALPLPTAKAIEIVAFVPAESIDPIAVGTPYYLMASGPASAKPYVLLRMALERSSKVAVAKVALRGRERLALLRVVGEAIGSLGYSSVRNRAAIRLCRTSHPAGWEALCCLGE